MLSELAYDLLLEMCQASNIAPMHPQCCQALPIILNVVAPRNHPEDRHLDRYKTGRTTEVWAAGLQYAAD